MASAIIHLCVAKEIGRRLGIPNNNLLIGSIAPDISKLVGESKGKSHYLTFNEDIPNMDLFLKENKEHLNFPFELGYYIHLYTDKLWFKGFFIKFICNNSLKLKDGSILNANPNFISDIIYNDYSNLNVELIEKYNLDLKIFYEEPNITTTYINGYPIDKIKLLIDKMGSIILKSKSKPTYVLDLEEITKFIDTSVDIIIKDIQELNII